MDSEKPVTDGELIQWLDAELGGPVRSAVDGRMASLPDSRPRLERLQRRGVRLSALLAHVDADEVKVQQSALAIRPLVMARTVAPVPHWRHALQAAAAIAMLLALAFVVPPARAWMIERARELAVALGLESRDDTRDAGAGPWPTQVAPITIAFEVGADTLDVFAAPRSGRLILRRNDGVNGTAEALGAAAAAFIVLPRGLRIEGPNIPDATYVIGLPVQVKAIRLHQPGRPRTLHPLPARETHIDLSGG